MRGKTGAALLCAAVSLAFLTPVLNHSASRAAAQERVRKMSITGQIAMASHGYIIRGRQPMEVFTILNPDAAALDGLVESGKEVALEVHVVSGDNVNIEQIDGSPYGPSPAPKKMLREMNVTGEIGKVAHGYVIRGKARAVILTILNPRPEVLDPLADTGRTVVVDVRVVSGDNVNIEKINGEPYPPGARGAGD